MGREKRRRRVAKPWGRTGLSGEEIRTRRSRKRGHSKRVMNIASSLGTPCRDEKAFGLSRKELEGRTPGRLNHAAEQPKNGWSEKPRSRNATKTMHGEKMWGGNSIQTPNDKCRYLKIETSYY